MSMEDGYNSNAPINANPHYPPPEGGGFVNYEVQKTLPRGYFI